MWMRALRVTPEICPFALMKKGKQSAAFFEGWRTVRTIGEEIDP